MTNIARSAAAVLPAATWPAAVTSLQPRSSGDVVDRENPRGIEPRSTLALGTASPEHDEQHLRAFARFDRVRHVCWNTNDGSGDR